MTTIDRILLLREERNLTSKEIENGAGLAASSISQWKKGKGKPNLDNIVKLANYFQVSADYLLCLSDDRRSYENEQALTEEEMLLLDAFHHASAMDRFRIIQLCMNTVDHQAGPYRSEKEAEPVREYSNIVYLHQRKTE